MAFVTLPPVVSDPERCDSAIVGYNPPHAWGPLVIDTGPGIAAYPDIEVCRFCGGRKP